MLRFFDILKKIETSVKFEKNSRNADVFQREILVGKAGRANVAEWMNPLSLHTFLSPDTSDQREAGDGNRGRNIEKQGTETSPPVME